MFRDGQEAILVDKTSSILIGVRAGVAYQAERMNMQFLSQMIVREEGNEEVQNAGFSKRKTPCDCDADELWQEVCSRRCVVCFKDAQ